MRNKILKSANTKYHYFYFFFYRTRRLAFDVFCVFGRCIHRFSREQKPTKSRNSLQTQRNTSKVSLLYLFCRKKVKLMIFSFCKRRYSISHTVSTVALTLCEKVNLLVSF